MTIRGVRVVTDLGECAGLWCAHGPAETIFDDWEVRSTLARISGVEPHFVVDESTGTVLPTGLIGEDLTFYGGRYYAEWNTFRGLPGGERKLLDWLASSGFQFRLLAWKSDPCPHLPPRRMAWDVPFNQYWLHNPGREFEDAFTALPAKVGKEARYLTRKYTLETAAAPQAAMGRIEEYMEHTVTSFAKRGASCAYADREARESALSLCRTYAARGALRLIELRYKDADVGLVVLIDDPSNARAVYLLSLYRASPSDISNGATVAVLDYAYKHGREIDGLRGAFTLKRKFGFTPSPSYALVNDGDWIVQPQSDLDSEELRRLYGRAFGRTGSAGD